MSSVLFEIVECLLRIEQITLLDGWSFSRVKADRETSTRRKKAGKSRGTNSFVIHGDRLTAPSKLRIFVHQTRFSRQLSRCLLTLSLSPHVRRSSWRLFPEKMITSFPTTLRRATYEFHELPPSLRRVPDIIALPPSFSFSLGRAFLLLFRRRRSVGTTSKRPTWPLIRERVMPFCSRGAFLVTSMNENAKIRENAVTRARREKFYMSSTHSLCFNYQQPYWTTISPSNC